MQSDIIILRKHSLINLKQEGDGMGKSETKRIDLYFNSTNPDAIEAYNYLKFRVGAKEKSKVVIKLIAEYIRNGERTAGDMEQLKREVKDELLREIEQKLAMSGIRLAQSPDLQSPLNGEVKSNVEQVSLDLQRPEELVLTQEALKDADDIMDELTIFD